MTFAAADWQAPVDVSQMASWYSPTSSLSTTDAMSSLPSQLTAPAAGGGFFGDMSGLGKMQVGISGLQTLSNLWAAFQSMKMAKKSFKLDKRMAEANLGNQVKSYNTALTDRITTRAQLQGMSSAEADAYLNKHSLNTKGT